MAIDFEQNNKDRLPYLHYLEIYATKDPHEIAERCGIQYIDEEKCFVLSFLNRSYKASFPKFDIKREFDGFAPLELINAKILLLRFLIEGSKSTFTNTFKSYRDFPWGEVYFQQFSGRCINRFAFSYAKRTDALKAAMEKLNAQKIEESDCGYIVELMPNLYIKFLLWLPDDEFPPSAQILFSDNFVLAFSTEDMAVIGDIVIGTIGKINA